MGAHNPEPPFAVSNRVLYVLDAKPDLIETANPGSLRRSHPQKGMQRKAHIRREPQQIGRIG